MCEMNERAQSNAETMEELRARIKMLENENHLLRERLEKAGISYEDLVFAKGVNESDCYDPDQGARIKRFEVTDKVASDFFMMF